MSKDDEIAALVGICKLFDGEPSNFRPSETPEEIKQFFRRKPALSELQAALKAVLVKIYAHQRSAK